jgi:hypothetical protein
MRHFENCVPLLFIIACAVLVGYGGPSSAQYRQRHSPSIQEACPQGRAIRAKKNYPSSMTDCEVLDADTVAENRMLQRAPLANPKTVTPAQAGPPVRVFSTRQVDAIRMTTMSALAGEYCQEIIENGEGGRELIDAGIQYADFNTPEYKRIGRDAKVQLATINSAARCGEIWRVLGPGGSYGRDLVRLRRPSDPPYKRNPLRQD